MPTGYTATVQEGATFEQFVWRCARAMGALIMMRDDSMDAAIPERFEPGDYHQKQLEQAQSKLTELLAMSDEEAQKCAQHSYDEQCARVFVSQKEDAARAAKYQAMIERVETWTPPTPEHEGFKDFMLQQLRESMKFDCGYEHPAPVLLTSKQWKAEQIERANRDIEYHTNEHREEVERTEARNLWLAQLRESVPYPSSK